MNIGFKRLLLYWVIFAVAMGLVNSFTLKNFFLHSLIFVSLGIFLLIYPVYTYEMKVKYGIEKSKKYIRLIAIVQIIISFLIKTTFK